VSEKLDIRRPESIIRRFALLKRPEGWIWPWPDKIKIG
jgi:hypothetical protein